MLCIAFAASTRPLPPNISALGSARGPVLPILSQALSVGGGTVVDTQAGVCRVPQHQGKHLAQVHSVVDFPWNRQTSTLSHSEHHSLRMEIST